MGLQCESGKRIGLIGHPGKYGHLTGRAKAGERCELWQCYWTTNPTGADNIHQWVPKDQIIGLHYTLCNRIDILGL